MRGTRDAAVLVTGATGTVGGAVVRELLARGAAVRALVRDPGRAAEVLGELPELVVGDLGDPASLVTAAAGVDQVFLCAANHPRQVAHELKMIDAAAGAGARRVVKVSALGAKVGAPVAFWDAHARIERHLERSGISWVVLRPSAYMSNLLAAAATVRRAGALFAPAGDARIALTDPRDVAAVAAAVLAAHGHEGRTYTLTGPEALTYHEVAKELSAAVGRPVGYVNVTDADARAAMIEAGLPAWTADQIVAVWRELRHGVAGTPTDVVRVLTGREPRTLADFCADHAAAFR